MKIPRHAPTVRKSPAADSDIGHVLDSVRRVVRVLRLGSRNAEKQVGLSSAQLFVLQRLSEGGALSVNEVAARTHTHQSSVSVVVQRLVDRGLVSRTRSEKDARRMELSATAAGRAVLRSAPMATQDQFIKALKKMRAPQLHQLAASLQRLVDVLGVDKKQPAAMLFEDEERDRKVRRNGRSRNRS